MFFIIRRWLKLPVDLSSLDKDNSLPSFWKQNETIDLPKDRKYQNCIIKINTKQGAHGLNFTEVEHMPENGIIMQLVMMGDNIWLCLFKADFTDKNKVRGNLKAKMRIQDFEEVSIDKLELKRVNFVYKL